MSQEGSREWARQPEMKPGFHTEGAKKAETPPKATSIELSSAEAHMLAKLGDHETRTPHEDAALKDLMEEKGITVDSGRLFVKIDGDVVIFDTDGKEFGTVTEYRDDSPLTVPGTEMDQAA